MLLKKAKQNEWIIYLSNISTYTNNVDIFFYIALFHIKTK